MTLHDPRAESGSTALPLGGTSTEKPMTPVEAALIMRDCWHGVMGDDGFYYPPAEVRFVLNKHRQPNKPNEPLNEVAFRILAVEVCRLREAMILEEANADSNADEVGQLRVIFSRILEALGSGGCTPDCSVDFYAQIPAEISAVLGDLRKRAQWQPIETAPMEGRRVLCLSKTGCVFIGRWSELERCFLDESSLLYNATHWMPLPEPPKEEQAG